MERFERPLNEKELEAALYSSGDENELNEDYELSHNESDSEEDYAPAPTRSPLRVLLSSEITGVDQNISNNDESDQSEPRKSSVNFLAQDEESEIRTNNEDVDVGAVSDNESQSSNYSRTVSPSSHSAPLPSPLPPAKKIKIQSKKEDPIGEGMLKADQEKIVYWKRKEENRKQTK
ncbi:hypothetical protein JTB14_012971 [Gonioctena quinquepunctata]|nr:hypothetical protein JTB14_012971 [Gonioctena quinquepunctata]